MKEEEEEGRRAAEEGRKDEVETFSKEEKGARGGSTTGENVATLVSREGENICKGLEPDARKKNEKIEISETERPLEEKRLEGKILEDDKRPVEGGERLEGMAKVKSNGNCNGKVLVTSKYFIIVISP